MNTPIESARFGGSGLNLAAAFSVLVVFSAIFAACNIPILETEECIASRGTVREFYSFHFGNEMLFSQDNLNSRKKFLTRRFVEVLSKMQTDNDVFTVNSTDVPKAFRVGGCKVISSDRTSFQVLFFWRDTNRSEERSINVETALIDGKWLVDHIDN